MESHEHTYIIKDAANKDEGRSTFIFYLLRVYSYLPRVCLKSTVSNYGHFISITFTAMTHTPCNIYLVFHLLCDFGQGILHPRDSFPIEIILLLSDCSSKYMTPDLVGYINKECNVWFPQLQIIYGVPICNHTKLHCTESRFSFHHNGNNQKGNTNRCTSGCDNLSCVDSKPSMLTLHIESLSVYHGCWEFLGTGQMPLSSCIIKLRKQCFFSPSFTGQFLEKNHSADCAIHAEGQMAAFVWGCVPANTAPPAHALSLCGRGTDRIQ